MRWPLSRQILLPMAGILLVTVGVVSALNAWLAFGRVHRQLDGQLADVTRTLTATNFPLESGVLKQTHGLTGAEYVVADAAGQPTAASDNVLLELARQQGPKSRRFDPSQTVRAEDGRLFFHAAVPLDRRPVGGGKLMLHVFYPEAAWREARWQAIWPPLAIGAAAVALVALAAYGVARRVTRPIEQLKSQVEKIAQGNFQPMPIPPRDDEVRQLVAAVNRLAEKLAHYEEEIRVSERLKTLGTLGGGIAHQVRNAATGCRIALDLHQRDCPLASAAPADDEPLAVAVRQLEQIEAHIQRLLALGQPATAMRKPLDLSDVIEQAAALVRPMAQHVRVALSLEKARQSLVVSGDSSALVQLVVNLLVNGVQASSQAYALAGAGDAPEEPTVVVRAEMSGGRYGRLAVGDSGPGPALEIQGRLFEPFATDKPGGTGLGLVVARRIAEDHGGTIGWERRAERTWFFVDLPLVADNVAGGASPTDRTGAT